MGRPAAAFLLLALVLMPGALPAVAQSGNGILLLVEVEGNGTRVTDVRHLSHRFYFRVTNPGDAPEYVTIPRTEIRWTAGAGGTALGFPSPEFGRALAPGETGRMWVRLDLPEPRPGTYTASVPFRAESTGATTAREVTLTVSAEAPAAAAGLSVRVFDAHGVPLPDAQVQVTPLHVPPLGAEADRPARVDPGGGWTGNLAPGRYAVRADAPGRSGTTRVVDVEAGGRENVEFRLVPLTARVTATDVTVTTVALADSIWTTGASADLARVATAPMTHNGPTPGAFHGVEAGEMAWQVAFPAADDARASHASPFQALDTTVAVSPDGALAAGMDWNGRLHVIDWETGEVLWDTDREGDENPLYPPASPYRRGFFTSGAVAFSPDGARLAAGGSNGRLVLFDAATGDARWTRAFGGEIRALRFTPDGAGLAAGAGDWKLRFLDAATGETKWEGDNEFWPFLSIATDPAGAQVGAGGKDSVFTAWDVETGNVQWRLDVHPGFVTGGTLTPDGGAVVSDWSYGVHGLGPDGTHRWFRRHPTATAASTPDGAFTFASSREPGAGTLTFTLLDGNGTTLWRHAPDLGTHCRATVSPFSREHAQAVHLHGESTEEGTALTAVAGCIGGTLFRFRIPVTATGADGAPTVVSDPAPEDRLPPDEESRTPRPPPPDETSRTPQAETPASRGTPAAAGILVPAAAAAAALLLGRRRNGRG